MPTVRDQVHHLLRAHDMTTVFGNPGSTELGFLTGWPEDFRYVLGLSEAAVVAMADGHSQLTRSPTLVSLHGSAGLGNAMGSIVNAHHNRAPLIVLVGQQERGLLAGDPFLASMDPTLIPLPYTKKAWQPARAADVPAVLARAIRTAAQPPSGPVVVFVPNDDWGTDTESAAPPVGQHEYSFGPDTSALERIAVTLQNSRRPAFVVGSAVDQDGAVTHAVELAQACAALVYAAPMSSRCSFPEDHPLFAGHLPASPGPLAEALQRHDLVVVLGAPAFTYHTTSAPGPALPPVVVISDDDQILARAPGRGLRSTMTLALRALADRIIPTPAAEPALRTPPADPVPPAAGEPWTAAYVLATLRSVLPADALVVEEIPSHRNDLHEFLPITAIDTGLLTTGGGVLGYALPAAIGASLAAPHRPVVVLVGDGSLMYTVQALWTATRYNVGITVIVLDNQGYGALRSMADAAGATSVPGLELGGLDPVALAEAMGCLGRRVDNDADLPAALTSALTRTDTPTLIHVMVA